MSAPLAGVKIIDLSQVIAGPYGPALLSHAGAEVVKIEALTGEAGRVLAASFITLNRGKRDLPLNLQTAAGREVLYRLAKQSDVLVENFRPGVVERLRVDYATLAALNPRLISVSVSAFGASGPYAHRPAFDPLLQALTGVERAQGGDGNPPVFLRIAVVDYTTALNQAAQVALALFDRERSGRGCHLQLSLLRTGVFINGDAFTRYAGRPPRRIADAGQHGLGPLDRMYRTADGWLFLVVAGEQSWQRLTSLPPLVPLAADERFATLAARERDAEALATALGAAFERDTTESWVAALAAAGVACAPVIVGYERVFFEDVQPIVNGYSVWGQHAERGRVEHPGNFIRYSDAPTERAGIPAPSLGQHSDELLRELGYADAEIGALRAAGVIHQAP